jgi:large subunit ribosomal protein L13
MKTTLVKPEEVERKWYVIDAADKVLGRMSVEIADILRGKNKATYTPNVDTGDYVVVINADKVALSGKKEEQKKYMFYTGYMGNEHYKSVGDFRKNKPAFIIEHSVKGMLPKNKLAYSMIKKLKIYGGSEHPHEAQNPIVLN